MKDMYISIQIHVMYSIIDRCLRGRNRAKLISWLEQKYDNSILKSTVCAYMYLLCEKVTDVPFYITSRTHQISFSE